MTQTAQVVDIILRARRAADLETADQADSVVTDAEFLVELNVAFRKLYDIIADAAGHEYFATSATLTSPSFALPAGFYQCLGVDIPNFYGTSQPYTVERFSFRERNRRAAWLAQTGYVAPTYRIQSGAVVWEPASAAPTSSVTLWYIPTPSALASNGSFDAFNGYDDYVVWSLARWAKEKQEENADSVLLQLAQAEQRVRRCAGRIVQDPVTVADVRDCYDGSYLNR